MDHKEIQPLRWTRLVNAGPPEMKFAYATMEIAVSLLYDISNVFGSAKINASLELVL